MAELCSHCGQVHPPRVIVCPVTGDRIASHTLVSEDESLVGSVVSERYVVREVLGQGTSGTVFAAEHLGFPRAAAMKVLRPRYVNAETLIRVFHGEARAAFGVSHPCLVDVFDVGQLPDGAPYFVMERLTGTTLASQLNRERLTLGAGVDVMMQLLSAIDKVHSQDLLLRDLRPQNVFLADRRGCRPLVKILDFGLARLVPLEKVQEEWDSLRGLDSANDASGALSVPYYLSPERARSERDVERTSDLFVAATIFYEILTGAKPFMSSSFNGLLLSIAQAAPAPPSELRAEVPQELDDLVLRTLSRNPRSRPSSARELQDELLAIFERTRRGSKEMRAAAPSAGGLVAAPAAAAAQAAKNGPPRDRVGVLPDAQQAAPSPARGAAPAPGSQAASRAAAREEPVDPDYEEEETRTDRRYARLREAAHDDAQPGAQASAAAAPAAKTSSAVPGIEIEIDLEGHEEVTATTRLDKLEEARAEATANRAAKPTASGDAEPVGSYDEETETMHLPPELRARLDQVAKNIEGAPSPAPPPRAKPSR